MEKETKGSKMKRINKRLRKKPMRKNYTGKLKVLTQGLKLVMYVQLPKVCVLVGKSTDGA